MVLRWAIVAALLVAVALALNRLVPSIRGHLAMGLAASILLAVAYLARSLDVDPFG